MLKSNVFKVSSKNVILSYDIYKKIHQQTLSSKFRAHIPITTPTPLIAAANQPTIMDQPQVYPPASLVQLLICPNIPSTISIQAHAPPSKVAVSTPVKRFDHLNPHKAVRIANPDEMHANVLRT